MAYINANQELELNYDGGRILEDCLKYSPLSIPIDESKYLHLKKNTNEDEPPTNKDILFCVKDGEDSNKMYHSIGEYNRKTECFFDDRLGESINLKDVLYWCSLPE